jgi:prevent-host-death family protein
MQPKLSQIAAGEFKAKCLQLMDQVHDTHVPIIITKHGVPVAKLVPIEEDSLNLFGLQLNSVVIQGDIISPIEEEWDANK